MSNRALQRYLRGEVGGLGLEDPAVKSVLFLIAGKVEERDDRIHKALEHVIQKHGDWK